MVCIRPVSVLSKNRLITWSNKKSIMKKLVYLLCILMMHPSYASTDGEQNKSKVASAEPDSAWKYRVRIIKLEKQFSTSNDEEYGEWAGFIMVGKDRNKLLLTTKGSTQHGETDRSEFRLFYARTIRPHIGLEVGWRRDLKPEPERDWLSIGLLGVLPYKIGADASLFIGESGRLAARLEIAYKYWFTPKLSLTPDFEANFYSEDDPERGIGSGLSDLDLGLRLRYQVIKGVSPYAGITWKGNFGKTADMIERRGEDPDDLRIMLGVSLGY